MTPAAMAKTVPTRTTWRRVGGAGGGTVRRRDGPGGRPGRRGQWRARVIRAVTSSASRGVGEVHDREPPPGSCQARGATWSPHSRVPPPQGVLGRRRRVGRRVLRTASPATTRAHGDEDATGPCSARLRSFVPPSSAKSMAFRGQVVGHAVDQIGDGEEQRAGEGGEEDQVPGRLRQARRPTASAAHHHKRAQPTEAAGPRGGRGGAGRPATRLPCRCSGSMTRRAPATAPSSSRSTTADGEQQGRLGRRVTASAGCHRRGRGGRGPGRRRPRPMAT